PRGLPPRARSISTDDWRTEPLGEPLRHYARRDVGRPAGRKADDQADRSRRVGLRPRGPRQRKRRSSCCEVEKATTGALHQRARPMRKYVSIAPLPLMSSGPRGSNAKSSRRRGYVSPENWMRPGTPKLSIRLAVFTVSPQTS